MDKCEHFDITKMQYLLWVSWRILRIMTADTSSLKNTEKILKLKVMIFLTSFKFCLFEIQHDISDESQLLNFFENCS